MVDLGGSVRSSAARKRRVRERINRARVVGGAILAFDTYETFELVDAFIAADVLLHDPRSSSAEIAAADDRRDAIHDALIPRLRGQSVRRGGYVLSVGGSGDLGSIAVLNPVDVGSDVAFVPEVEIARRLTLGQPIDRLSRNTLIGYLVDVAGVSAELVDDVLGALEGSPPPATRRELDQLARDLVAAGNRDRRVDPPHVEPIPAPLSPVSDPNRVGWELIHKTVTGCPLSRGEALAVVLILGLSGAMSWGEVDAEKAKIMSQGPEAMGTFVNERARGRFGVSFGRDPKPVVEPAPGPGVQT